MPHLLCLRTQAVVNKSYCPGRVHHHEVFFFTALREPPALALRSLRSQRISDLNI